MSWNKAQEPLTLEPQFVVENVVGGEHVHLRDVCPFINWNIACGSTGSNNTNQVQLELGAKQPL